VTTVLLWARPVVGAMLLALVALFVWSASRAGEPDDHRGNDR
jgi:hypothetical protein